MNYFKQILTGILLLISFNLFSQQVIKGVVKDKATGETLPGVNILIKGTTNGTSSDFDGLFELKANKGEILVFSFIGFNDLELTVSDNLNVVVEMIESSEQLDEIVVVGYGTTTVKDATGSVEAITEKDFTKGNIVTPENLISGRVSGVSVTTSGAPGSGSQITIRGGSSISASNDPLIVIDGLPISNEGTAGSRGVLANINPNDIESMSVLKDASATAIYGSRAANGVIIITTKKGKTDYSLNYDYQLTLGSIQDRINVFGADDFRNMINTYEPGLVGSLGTANTNWQDQIFRNTSSSMHNITARGSIFKAIPTRLSLGISDIEGGVLTSNFKRGNFSISMNPSFLDDHLKLNINYNRNDEISTFADAGGAIGSAIRFDPTQAVYDPSSPFGGYYQHLDQNGDPLRGGRNPVASLLQRNNTGKSLRRYGNFNLNYKFHFLPELKFVANLGFDKVDSEYADFTGSDTPHASNAIFVGNDSYGTQTRENQLLDTYLNYVKDYESFGIDLTAGYSYQKFTNSGFNSGNLNNPDNASDTYTSPDVVNIGFFGRAKLNYLGKYLLTLNYRRDGTSRFSEDNRWGNFMGGAFAWRVSDEDFLKDSKVVSELKLRASYGETGQQNLPDINDIYLDRYRFGNSVSRYLIDGQPVIAYFPSPVNPDLKWEETATLEFGIDYGLFDGKVDGSLNYFKKTSKDLLFNAAVPDGINFTNSIIQNIGELEVDGIEFNLNSTIVETEDFRYDLTFNAAYLDRKITKLSNGQDVRTGGTTAGTGNTIQILREGFAPYSFFVFKQLYDTAGNPIEGAYVDLNGDGVINDNDRYLKENPAADVTLGLQSNISYKNFDLAFNLRASLGNYVYNDVNSSISQLALLRDGAVPGNIPTSILETNFVNTSDVLNSDIYVEDASFLKMDNITLGYTFQPKLNKFSDASVRLWLGVQNVFVLTNYSGLDPEVFNGIDNQIYPRSRNFLFGANIKL